MTPKESLFPIRWAGFKAGHWMGLWRGKFKKRVWTSLFEKPTTKTDKCKMETDGWLQFSIYFSVIGVSVVPCRCSKGSCYLWKTLVSIRVGKNMEYIQIWLKQGWQSISLWESQFFIPCFDISLSSLELKFSLMKSYCPLSYGQLFSQRPITVAGVLALLLCQHPSTWNRITEFLFKTIRITKPTCWEELWVLCKQVKQKMLS